MISDEPGTAGVESSLTKKAAAADRPFIVVSTPSMNHAAAGAGREVDVGCAISFTGDDGGACRTC